MFMKKNVGIWFLVVFGLTLILAACGEKSQESVVAKLEDKLSSMDGYKAKAEMKMSTGPEEHKYDLEILHQKDDKYRVTLSGDDAKGNQVIMKNEDGVFVLTPALNKSFKFQNEWPENSSQPYLFQSLVSDIQKDTDAEFQSTDTHYIFRTKTNYQSNNNLPSQEIYFDKKTYTPTHVKVLDKDNVAIVEVQFSAFEMDPNFAQSDFEIEKNMAGDQVETPVMSHEQEAFPVVFPLETAGATLADKKDVVMDNGRRVIMTFEGEKNFTLVQEKLDVIPTISTPKEIDGEIVNLGIAIGALSNNTIAWNKNGIDYYLASETLTRDELINVAKSVQGKEVK